MKIQDTVIVKNCHIFEALKTYFLRNLSIFWNNIFTFPYTVCEYELCLPGMCGQFVFIALSSPLCSSPSHSLSSPVIFSFFLITPHLSHFTASSLLPLMLSSVFLYSYPSSIICAVFLSPVMLSSLPSYPSCLISSYFPLMLSSISLFVSLVILPTACHSQFCLNSV